MVRGLIQQFKHAPGRGLKYLDPSRTMSRIAFLKEFRAFKKMMSRSEPRFSLKWEDRYICMNDRTPSTEFDRHYIYHPAWAARVLAQTKPASHVDFSSSIHFCSMLSAFVPVRFYDYRPAKLDLSNLSSEAADLLALPFADQSVNSLSCMHVVEHVGLGRYGDQLDPDGDLKAMAELKRVLSPGGSLLFVVPIGKPKIMFNGHRIYSYEQVMKYFAELKLQEFTLIPDDPADGGLIYNASQEMADSQEYGCGCFWFTR
jgi:SAM-dependent methyltransferase